MIGSFRDVLGSVPGLVTRGCPRPWRARLALVAFEVKFFHDGATALPWRDQVKVLPAVSNAMYATSRSRAVTPPIANANAIGGVDDEDPLYPSTETEELSKLLETSISVDSMRKKEKMSMQYQKAKAKPKDKSPRAKAREGQALSKP